MWVRLLRRGRGSSDGNNMNKERAINYLGYIGTIIALLMFISLIEIARSNMLGNSHIFIQPLVTTLNCGIWSTYAFLKKERFVFYANAPGVFLGLVTLMSAFIG